MAYQRIIIEGNVGQDPQIKQFQDGSIAQFTVAVTERAYTTASGRQVPEHTEWFRCVVRNKAVTIIQNYVRKGDKILVEGKLRTREYVDGNNVQKSTTELLVDNVSLLSAKPADQAQVPQGYQQQPQNYQQLSFQQTAQHPYQQQFTRQPQNGYIQPPSNEPPF